MYLEPIALSTKVVLHSISPKRIIGCGEKGHIGGSGGGHDR